jgi:hypothetical protein
MSQQIYRPPVIGNFRPSIRERAKKKPSAAERREGNSEAHLALIRQLPCCVGGSGHIDPHHLRCGPAAKERGTGQKATDQWVVPLSREAHEDAHRVGSRAEDGWFRARGIEDVVELARALFRVTGDLDAMRRVLWAHMNGGKPNAV